MGAVATGPALMPTVLGLPDRSPGLCKRAGPESSYTLTMSLPAFEPSKSLLMALGACSNPSTTSTL